MLNIKLLLLLYHNGGIQAKLTIVTDDGEIAKNIDVKEYISQIGKSFKKVQIIIMMILNMNRLLLLFVK